MQFSKGLFAFALALASGLWATGTVQQQDDGSKKLNALLGKWHLEGIQNNNGLKSSSNHDCRWSPHRAFMVCEQITKTAGGERSQLTIYAYDRETGKYSYTAGSGSGAKPTNGVLEIKGAVWTLSGNVESAGKAIQFRTVREFLDAKTSSFQIMRSDDGGEHWQTILEAKMQKISD
jgi:hypothetical protein